MFSLIFHADLTWFWNDVIIQDCFYWSLKIRINWSICLFNGIWNHFLWRGRNKKYYVILLSQQNTWCIGWTYLYSVIYPFRQRETMTLDNIISSISTLRTLIFIVIIFSAIHCFENKSLLYCTSSLFLSIIYPLSVKYSELSSFILSQILHFLVSHNVHSISNIH